MSQIVRHGNSRREEEEEEVLLTHKTKVVVMLRRDGLAEPIKTKSLRFRDSNFNNGLRIDYPKWGEEDTVPHQFTTHRSQRTFYRK